MSDAVILKQHVVDSWDFPWHEIEVLIGGKSSIDLPAMNVKDWQDATAFVCNYGYDPARDMDLRLMQAVYIEAIHFIESTLLKNDLHRYPIPDPILQSEDLRQVILWASDQHADNKTLRIWACAVLRVVHTIAHIEGVQRRVAVDLADQQIRGRFHLHLREDDQGRLWLGDHKNRVELERFEWKAAKTRNAMILKLLHKRANVAETIYDLLGVRIVTKRLCDVMMVVKYIRKFYMITFANCNPGRSRNTLIEIDTFRRNTDMLRGLLLQDRINPGQFSNLIEQMTIPAQLGGKSINPHSASNYRAIQLTCRQLIRTPNPEIGWLRTLKYHAERDDKLAKVVDYIEDWPDFAQNSELAAFFPFEVQIMDRETFEANQSGAAAHNRYKHSQWRAARRRVLGEVLRLMK